MGIPVESLTKEVLRLAVKAEVREQGPDAPIRALVAAASPAELEACVVRLDEHRLLGLAHYALARHQLLELFPTAQARALRVHYDYARALGTMSQLTLRGVAAQFAGSGVHPVACKGVVLQSHYYPDPGMRFMQDIDLWVPPGSRGACESALLGLGFAPAPHQLPDGGNFTNAAGINIDLHWRMRLFESIPGGFESLTEDAPGGGFRVFEPHALLTHLCAHMLGHYPDTGPMLCWLIDLGFVLRKVGHRIDVSRLERMMPSPTHWLTLLRCVGLLSDELGFEVPVELKHAASRVEPLRFASALRLRRLALWGLPSAMGWGRLLASATRLRRSSGLPWPSLTDLSLWPVDWAEQRWLAHKIR